MQEFKKVSIIRQLGEWTENWHLSITLEDDQTKEAGPSSVTNHTILAFKRLGLILNALGRWSHSASLEAMTSIGNLSLSSGEWMALNVADPAYLFWGCSVEVTAVVVVVIASLVTLLFKVLGLPRARTED